jgi:hypothetical protein
MCTDFTDLNKCCPKDDFPLTIIYKIVDSAAGCEVIALLDCFSSYHQVWLRKDDEKTIFITPSTTGPTFCRMMKAALKDKVGRNVLSYVDDIVVASKKKTSYISDLAETFTNMCEARLQLNPEKCIFGVTRGKVLGCLVSMKGIKANPDKIRVILHMWTLQNKREIQKLTDQIAALNKFIAKLAE